jgi:hypothetical protein
MPGIYLIVEGHGEERAVPRLIGNVCRHLSRGDFFIWPAYRVSRGSIVAGNGDMQQAVFTAGATINQAEGNGILFVLLDSDDDCAVTLAQSVRTKIHNMGFGFALSVVACVREYEGWFLTAASSLVGAPNVRTNATDIENAELIRDAKGTLERQVLIPGRYYSPTVDQADFSSRLNVTQALASRSFAKFVKELDLAVPT